jgi:hypothetical protein
VTSNPVAVYVHAQVSSVNLALTSAQKCYSQGQTAQLDSEACFASGGKQYELCAPASVSPAHYACALPDNVSSVPTCSSSIGALTYSIATSNIASLNNATNEITAGQPGTVAVTASVAGSGSSAGYFTTCPPKSIAVTLNGATSGTVTQGVTQNLVTTVLDTNNQPITGLTLDYQSTNQVDIGVGAGGSVVPNFPGAASVYAICQPASCNPAPINQVGLFGTGVPISSNAVNLNTPGTASAYAWFGAPGKSQYFVAYDLLNNAVSSTVRLPYVPNSMMMDASGSTLYFGSSHALMTYNTLSNSAGSNPNTSVPGVVLAVSPDNHQILINDQVRRVFYLYNTTGTISATFSGVGTAAAWTPDAKTLYVVDSASQGSGHTDTLYVYNLNSGWTTYDLSSSGGATGLAFTIPSVGAYLAGNPTVAHTWCPSGIASNYASIKFYPEGDSVATDTSVLGATSNGQHILGAAIVGGAVQLSDIGVSIPFTPTSGTGSGGANQVVNLPIACPQDTSTTPSTL